jgi:hypothetical protein
MVHVESLSRGLPLDSFFFGGETLSYYWLAYVYPALLNNLEWLQLENRQIMQITTLLYSLTVTAALVIFLKGITRSRKLWIGLIALALCGYSYLGLYTIILKGYGWLTGSGHIELLGIIRHNFQVFSCLLPFFLLNLRPPLQSE